MGEQEVLRSNQITSPTEALDAILGSSSGDGGTADSQPTSPSETSAVPRDAKDAERKDGDANPSNVEVFNWSSKDPFFLFSDCECVAMGGGSAFASISTRISCTVSLSPRPPSARHVSLRAKTSSSATWSCGHLMTHTSRRLGDHPVDTF